MRRTRPECKEVNTPVSSLQVMADTLWWLKVLTYSLQYQFRGCLAKSPKCSHRVELQLPLMVTYPLVYSVLVSLTSLSNLPIPLSMIPRVISQINLHTYNLVAGSALMELKLNQNAC
jgi:hypothetical protein